MKTTLSYIFVFFSVFCFAQEKSVMSQRFHIAFDVVKTSFKTVPSDFVYMGKNITDDWQQTALYTGIVGGLMLFDKPVTTFYQNEIETRIDYSIPEITLSPFKNSQVAWLKGNDAYMTYTTQELLI